MKRIRIVGASAVAGTAASVAAYFLHPRSGSGRRAALKRGGAKVARTSANVAAMMGTGGSRGGRHAHPGQDALRAEVAEQLADRLGNAGPALSVVVGDGVITVRGEVDDLGAVATVSRVLAEFDDDAEVVNLVRVRVVGGGAATG